MVPPFKTNNMDVNVKLSNAVFYGVRKFAIRLGEKFEVMLDTDNASFQWFSNNDPALFISVAEDGRSAQIEAREKGKCSIQFQSPVGTVVKDLELEIYDNVAVDLGVKAGSPELK